jgi:hypothetical protein
MAKINYVGSIRGGVSCVSKGADYSFEAGTSVDVPAELAAELLARPDFESAVKATAQTQEDSA